MFLILEMQAGFQLQAFLSQKGLATCATYVNNMAIGIVTDLIL